MKKNSKSSRGLNLKNFGIIGRQDPKVGENFHKIAKIRVGELNERELN